jgi:hypothetical protein
MLVALLGLEGLAHFNAVIKLGSEDGVKATLSHGLVKVDVTAHYSVVS